MEWKQPPLHRHLSTIGIGPVFICPPPHSLPEPEPAANIDGSKADGKDTTIGPSRSDKCEIIDTWEILGDIKSSPQDFLVREIGWAPYLQSSGDACDGKPSGRLPGWSRKIAGLDCRINDKGTIHSHDNTNDIASCISNRNTADVKQSSVKKSRVEETNSVETSRLPESRKNEPAEEPCAEDSFDHKNPLHGLRRILELCLSKHDTNTDEDGQSFAETETMLKHLSDLQKSAIRSIDSSNPTPAAADGDDRDNEVWIPTSGITQNAMTHAQQNWKLLHQYIRTIFPLLKTEGSAVGPWNKPNSTEPSHKAWVRVDIDKTFFPIASLLAKPSEDLLALYAFRNNGPTIAPSNCSNRTRNNNKHHRGNRTKDAEQQTNNNTVSLDNNGQVLLRLRPDLPRSDRRLIHQTLTSSRRRDFDTSTLNDIHLNQVGDESTATSAIVVQWSRSAIQGSQKKRKRNDGDDATKPIISAVFCVLRKEQCEHQVAINKIARALKCRVGDIGLAGIKDMQAVTYQFCTLRNVDLKKVQRVNKSLGPRVQLSDCVIVQGPDVLLDRGKLLGNRFEITLRNMKRVQRMQIKSDASWKEQYIPVQASHVDAMVKRIRDYGFINFYGEQRVGDAGHQSHVGVRSFDVGKAMLTEDFTAAIDLIMDGRSHEVYNPSPEEVEARKVWRKTKDARETLAKLPKNTSTMTRERDLIRGMVRYDNALEAIRCVHHNVRMFWIHAYQSFVWNRVASQRVKRFGLSPVIGDLYEDNGNDTEVKVVSDPSSVDISQIILPLPGYNIQYPTNEIGELYKAILSQDGIILSKDKIPEATAKGSYRKLIQKASGLSWEMVESEAECKESADVIVSNAKFTFELESGSYATMMLRELTVATMSRDCKVSKE